jgi:transcriptional regulator with XRE-family HTH domain
MLAPTKKTAATSIAGNRVICLLDWKRHHGRASATVSGVWNPNNDGSGSPLPRSRKASRKIKNFSAGMAPRAFQLLTAGKPTPPKAATEVVPPSASMTESTVVSIPLDYSRCVNMSSLHGLPIFTGCESRTNNKMARSQKDIAYRLELTRTALGLTAAKLCRIVGLGTNQWSQFVDPNGNRRITPNAIFRLKDEYGITFEWIYDADRSRLPSDLLEKIREVERRGGVDLSRTRGRQSPEPQKIKNSA